VHLVNNFVSHLTASESADLGNFSLPLKICYECYKSTDDS